MPELPEVETIRLELNAHILGKKIQKFLINQEKAVIGNVDSILEKEITSVLRLGKYLVFCLSNGFFVILHLKMSGRILLSEHEDPVSKHLKASFFLSEGIRVDFQDVRKFGRIWISDNLDMIQNKLGVEPISDYFTSSALEELLSKKSKTSLKTFLLDQKILAGIGNIYADEICFVAGLSPFGLIKTLDSSEKEKLYFAIKEVLKGAIAKKGTSLGTGLTNFKTPYGETGRNFEGLKVYGQQGLNCLRCGNEIQKCKFASRGTHFCPNCQPEPKYESIGHRR